MTSRAFDVAVVGAGVFGAWTAWHLQRAGQRVVLVDQHGPANARASSGGDTRVIRMAYGPDALYTRLAQRSLVLWKEFFDASGQPDLFRETGVLTLAPAGDASTAASVDALAGLGIAHALLDARTLATRWPQIALPPDCIGLFEPGSGGLYARRAVQAVVADARRAGMEFRIGRVNTPKGGGALTGVTLADGETIAARRFVFACGPWLGTLLPDALGGRIFPTRQEVFWFGAGAGDSRFVEGALPVWLDFGRSYYGFPDLDGRGVKIAHDAHGAPVDPDTLDRTPTAHGIAQARAFLAERFPALAGAPLLGAEVCQYENTSNGDFVIDRHPAFDNAWIAGGGSGHGFKHGPAVGEFLAARMLRDAPAEPRFSLASKGSTQRREVH